MSVECCARDGEWHSCKGFDRKGTSLDCLFRNGRYCESERARTYAWEQEKGISMTPKSCCKLC